MALHGLIKTRFLRRLSFSLLLSGTLLLLLPGCAVSPAVHHVPPPLLGHGPPVIVEDVDILEVTPRMHAFLQQYVLDYEGVELRRELLNLALVGKGVLSFHYNPDRTHTSVEAFESRSGNCIGFANLYIAMAREAGLEASYHEVILPPEWRSEEDTLLVAKHVNVVINGSRDAYQVDISGMSIHPQAQRKILEDHEGKALYYNNLAVDALLSGDLATAHAYLVKAIDTAPDMPDAWSNLGVVLSRNEQMQDAELAYRAALDIEPSDRTALNNLYELLLTQERTAEALVIERKVERYRRENPYYLLALSEEAALQDRFSESIDLLNRAIKKKEDEYRLHFALARSQYLSGLEAEAQLSLERARALAPREAQQEFMKPLDELVRMTGPAELQ
jgi:Tfp pilus assembly protein PilF